MALLKEILELLHSQLAVLGVIDIWVCNNFQKGHTHTIVVYQSIVLEIVKTLG